MKLFHPVVADGIAGGPLIAGPSEGRCVSRPESPGGALFSGVSLCPSSMSRILSISSGVSLALILPETIVVLCDDSIALIGVRKLFPDADKQVLALPSRRVSATLARTPFV